MRYVLVVLVLFGGVTARANEAVELGALVRRHDPYARVLAQADWQVRAHTTPANAARVSHLDSASVIRVPSFAPTQTCQQIQDALSELSRTGSKRIVLDLRGNSGGQRMVAVCAAGLFVGPKPIVGLIERESSIPNLHNLIDDDAPGAGGTPIWLSSTLPQATDLPLVVLMDAKTASAAEMVAAAIRDYGRGWLIGERTFGKGTSQMYSPVKGHPDLYLGYTREIWVSPNGESPEGRGLSPSRIPLPLRACAEKRLEGALAETDDLPLAWALAILVCASAEGFGF